MGLHEDGCDDGREHVVDRVSIDNVDGTLRLHLAPHLGGLAWIRVRSSDGFGEHADLVGSDLVEGDEVGARRNLINSFAAFGITCMSIIIVEYAVSNSRASLP